MKITHEWDLNDPDQKEQYYVVKNRENEIESLKAEIREKNKKIMQIHNLAIDVLYELEKSPAVIESIGLKRTIEKIQGYARV